MELTIITHLKDEEYLLNWWLEHHARMASKIILIDYGSSDGSRAIVDSFKGSCKLIWVETTNEAWIPSDVDEEIQSFERAEAGWVISLQITDFLVMDNFTLRYMLCHPEVTAWRIAGSIAVDCEPTLEPKFSEDLVEQKPWMIDEEKYVSLFPAMTGKSQFSKRAVLSKIASIFVPFISTKMAAKLMGDPFPRNRLLHREFEGLYSPGRHEWGNISEPAPGGVHVIHYSLSPWTEKMLSRKKKIRAAIPMRELLRGRGWGHLLPHRRQFKAMQYLSKNLLE